MDFAQPLTCSKHLNAEQFTRAGCRGRCWSRVTLLVFRSASWHPWFRPLTVHLAHRSFKTNRMFLTIHVLVIRVWPSWEGEATSASSLSFVTSPARSRLWTVACGVGAVSVQGFSRMLKGAVWSCRRRHPRLEESLGHFCMKVFTLEIKLYLGFLVSPPPPPPWEVSESYCGDSCNQKAVSISALHREALQAPSAPRPLGTLCTWGRTLCTWGNPVPVGGWASSGYWLCTPSTHILPSSANFGSTAEREFQT